MEEFRKTMLAASWGPGYDGRFEQARDGRRENAFREKWGRVSDGQTCMDTGERFYDQDHPSVGRVCSVKEVSQG